MKNPNTKEVTDLEVAKKMINIYQSAMDRKIEFNLSFDYVKKMLEFKTCYYTNIPFTEDGPHARSFDRVDSDKGYIEGNVVACNIDINGKKSNLTFDEIACIYHKLAKHKEPKVVTPKPKPKVKPKKPIISNEEAVNVLDKAIEVLGQESVNKLLENKPEENELPTLVTSQPEDK
jgi:hypothetical protein